MPKIVITDSDFEDNDFEIGMVRAAGIDIAVFNEREPEAIIRNAADADASSPRTATSRPKCSRRCPTYKW